MGFNDPEVKRKETGAGRNVRSFFIYLYYIVYIIYYLVWVTMRMSIIERYDWGRSATPHTPYHTIFFIFIPFSFHFSFSFRFLFSFHFLFLFHTFPTHYTRHFHFIFPFSSSLFRPSPSRKFSVAYYIIKRRICEANSTNNNIISVFLLYSKVHRVINYLERSDK